MVRFAKILFKLFVSVQFCLSPRKPGDTTSGRSRRRKWLINPRNCRKFCVGAAGAIPNPPDPWLELILEIGDPQIRQAAVAELVKMNIATARIQGEFWTGIQRAIGKG